MQKTLSVRILRRVLSPEELRALYSRYQRGKSAEAMAESVQLPVVLRKVVGISPVRQEGDLQPGSVEFKFLGSDKIVKGGIVR